MVGKEEILAFLKSKKEELSANFNLVKVGLFGSFARGEASLDSDIDLLIEFAPDTGDLSNKKREIKALIESRFGRKVDLCREKYIKPYFKKQILKSAIYV